MHHSFCMLRKVVLIQNVFESELLLLKKLSKLKAKIIKNVFKSTLRQKTCCKLLTGERSWTQFVVLLSLWTAVVKESEPTVTQLQTFGFSKLLSEERSCCCVSIYCPCNHLYKGSQPLPELHKHSHHPAPYVTVSTCSCGHIRQQTKGLITGLPHVPQRGQSQFCILRRVFVLRFKSWV